MITFACVWVTGHVPFTADYVVRLRNMVARHYPERHSFVCLTDRPAELAGIETIRTGAPVGYFAWWKKLELFAAKRLDRGRVVYLDLDTLVLADLTPIVEYPAPFALIPHAGSFKPKAPYSICARFNSSCMVWDGGTLGYLWDDWKPSITRRLWGDQDYLGVRVATNAAKTFPLEWFPRLSDIRSARPPQAAKVVLCKKPKNEEASQRFAWVREAWA